MNPKDPQADIREAILQILGIKERDLAPEPKSRIDALVALFQAREQQLLTELRKEARVFFDEYKNGLEPAIPVSVIEKYREELK